MLNARGLVVLVVMAAVMVISLARGADPQSKPSVPEVKIWEELPNPEGTTKPWWIEADNKGNLYLANVTADKGSGFHMSSDFGKTWSSITGTGLESPGSGFSIQVDPNTGWLIAGSAQAKGRAAYFYSTDTGKTWTKMTGYDALCCTNHGACFLPNGDILFGGHWGNMTAFYSTDHGKTCTRTTSKTSDGGGSFCIGYNPVTGDCWMGSESENKAIYRSTDKGRTWELVQTPTVAKHDEKLNDVMHITFNKAGDVLVQCIRSVYRTQDNGKTWQRVCNSGSAAGRGGWITTDPNGYIYVGDRTDPGIPAIRRSIANGDPDTWEDYSAGIPAGYKNTCIVYNPGDGRMYCCCLTAKDAKTSKIFRTIEPVAKPVKAAADTAPATSSAPGTAGGNLDTKG